MYKQVCRRVAAVQYLGSACRWCGWRGHVGAFHVHHIDPQTKVPGQDRATRFSAAGTSRHYLTQDEKAELDQCILLCANCHHTESVGSQNEYIKYVNIESGAYGSWEEVAWTQSQ